MEKYTLKLSDADIYNPPFESDVLFITYSKPKDGYLIEGMHYLFYDDENWSYGMFKIDKIYRNMVFIDIIKGWNSFTVFPIGCFFERHCVFPCAVEIPVEWKDKDFACYYEIDHEQMKSLIEIPIMEYRYIETKKQ